MEEEPNIPVAVEKWFEDYETSLSNIEHDSISREDCMGHFKELQRSCAVVNQKMVTMGKDMEVTLSNMSKISDISTKCQLSASTANIYASNFAPVKTEGGIFRKAVSLVVGSAHVISNWLLAIFQE